MSPFRAVFFLTLNLHDPDHNRERKSSADFLFGGETVAASPLKTSEKRDDFASVAADPIPKTLNLPAAAAVFPCRFLVNYVSLALFSGSVSFSKTLDSLPVRCLHFVSGFAYRLPPSILSISGSRSIYLFIGS
ncbi:hypothetical protein Q3G72_024274 [Acer saccharum]|nr:hypothetical protein Q3G72_024274 [Acer saccharum]